MEIKYFYAHNKKWNCNLKYTSKIIVEDSEIIEDAIGFRLIALVFLKDRKWDDGKSRGGSSNCRDTYKNISMRFNKDGYFEKMISDENE